MPIQPNAFVTSRATDLPTGSIFTTGGNWFIHAHIAEQRAMPPKSAAVALTFQGITTFIRSETCLALAPSFTADFRVIGPILGPGTPPPSALTWSWSNTPVIAAADTFVTLAGTEERDVSTDVSFYVPHWGVWVIDAAGNQVGDAPLFVVKAATSDADTP
ncbi:hypothetical protein FE36_19985 [Xanthomonas oryzae pv. oryzicola]|uniref:hypothetical protein n=1 Tax=Xanthomonas oryzae TaxID=347 RepID=UPI0006433FCD|nr:hypothetical protein [Xanthomonas oryzae]AKK65885.1 hypothetical protein FE36_19985 [Xanthomonas oryzae pv. oryzicola]